ncbi:MAG: hypothetical protein K0U39_08315 [Alphaproteobacteria bacterium]|nr:hypothetical protein [Alphaproteobacteria bacterium]
MKNKIKYALFLIKYALFAVRKNIQFLIYTMLGKCQECGRKRVGNIAVSPQMPNGKNMKPKTYHSLCENCMIRAMREMAGS